MKDLTSYMAYVHGKISICDIRMTIAFHKLILGVTSKYVIVRRLATVKINFTVLVEFPYLRSF